MSIRNAALGPAVVAVLALALSAAPATAAVKCSPGKRQKVVARSAQAVVLKARPFWYSGYQLWGCSRRTGARRLLTTGDEDRELRSVLLRGTHVGYVDAGTEETSYTVVSDDAVRRGRRIARDAAPDALDVALRMGDDGSLAWRDITRAGQRLWLWRPGDGPRLVDEGFNLTRMRFSGRTLGWRHGSADRASAPTRTACRGWAGPGSTTTVDAILSTHQTVRFCWRATGSSVTLPAGTPAVTGPWVAVASARQIWVVNLLTNEWRTVAWDGAVDAIVVDEHGSVAWTVPTYTSGGHPPEYLTKTVAVWVDDAAGTHASGVATIYDQVGIARDGSWVRWAVSGEVDGSATLLPRPAPPVTG
ncbi:hypothetical protein [Baekduia sp. Peel2402]|uniref:hypothetical protein n=1 Tax=Baekduia sp. Peel2402 TaxID=3458296 RepID=UPI00403E4226